MGAAAVAGGGALLGGITSGMQAKEDAKRQREAIKKNRLAARASYYSTEDSVNLMKAATREATTNAIAEVSRAGKATERELAQSIDKVASSVSASNEGLTSGRSKGRLMVDVFQKGNKMLKEADDNTTSQITRLLEAQDAKTADLNNKLLQTYQEMSAVLANEGPSLNPTNKIISGAIGGAKTGASVYNAFEDFDMSSISDIF
jgi:hypothetical protein